MTYIEFLKKTLKDLKERRLVHKLGHAWYDEEIKEFIKDIETRLGHLATERPFQRFYFLIMSVVLVNTWANVAHMSPY